jgi:hypothetical protein
VSEPILEITIEETAGIFREREPVTYGVPFPKGLISTSSELQVVDDEGNSVPVATTPLARWADDSIKWMLFDFQMSLPAKGKKCLQIYSESTDQETRQEDFAPPKLHKSSGKISVHTGRAEFELDACKLLPFSRITVTGHSVLREHASRIALVDEYDREWIPRIDKQTIEVQNLLRMVLAFEGTFISGTDVHVLRYTSRIHFFAGKSTVRFDFTLWNPCAACHPGGVWDLGDKGSILFHDLSINLVTEKTGQEKSYYSLDVGEPVKNIDGNILIYQDSSGGENWRSHNHINRDEQIPVTFQGFEVRTDQQVVSRGLRTTPCIASSNNSTAIAASVKHFWQNFPKALELENGNLIIRLFPKYFNDLFELQGGEQKTHTVYIRVEDSFIQEGFLDWIHNPLIIRVSPEWYHASGACYPRPVPLNSVASDAYCSAYQQMVDIAIRGKRSFFARREIIDEYGWRNFGDIYADHEAVFHKEEEEFVSHYNNQYDVIKGAIIQFMRTGEQVWSRLIDEYARHVSDIDIYHTDQDRYEYNNGLFWHTDHHLDAATSTHRGASRKHREFKEPQFVGTGPSASHNYTTGFLYHYWLTGNPRSQEGVMALADNIVKLFEGPEIVLERCVVAGKTIIKWLIKRLNRSLLEEEMVYGFNGPGRASGNALNTLLNAYLLRSDKNYMRCAEKLIRLCVSPDDNIEDRDLLNAEIRWFYTVFLQSLGKYLDIKYEAGQLDHAFWYARTVLLKYAAWMIDHEYPYLEKPEILEFPNESWAAQEIRKSDVLAHAARYAPEMLRQRLLEKSRFFFEVCIHQLQNDFAETRDLTRVIATLMTNGMAHMDAFSQLACVEDIASMDIDYTLLTPDASFQKNIVSEQLKWFRMIKNTSFKKEFRWLRQRLRNRFS